MFFKETISWISSTLMSKCPYSLSILQKIALYDGWSNKVSSFFQKARLLNFFEGLFFQCKSKLSSLSYLFALVNRNSHNGPNYVNSMKKTEKTIVFLITQWKQLKKLHSSCWNVAQHFLFLIKKFLSYLFYKKKLLKKQLTFFGPPVKTYVPLHSNAFLWLKL